MKYVIVFIISTFILFELSAQEEEISITVGPDEVALNQMFTISVHVKNSRLRSYDEFPEIEGFMKRGTSSSSNTSIVNGKISSTQSITQNYIPQREGTFRLPDFKMIVNGEQLQAKGKAITVGPARQRQNRSDPFEDFFGRRNRASEPEEIEYVDLEDDAFLAVTTDKNEIFQGEGVNVTVSFYVALDNRAPMQFHKLGEQLGDIISTLKPKNAWEENFGISQIDKEPVTINNKAYHKYKIYEASYFPFNDQDIVLPQVGLQMIKYKVARNPSFFGSNRKEDFKTFYSREKTVKVKPLPDHPLRNQVSVGKYTLSDKLDVKEVNTGDGFEFSYRISGEGNIAQINPPALPQIKEIEFFRPNVRENIRRSYGKVKGSQDFLYAGVAKEPGEYDFSEWFEWVYFDPERAVYDTLRPKSRLMAVGESLKNSSIQSQDYGSFYDNINSASNSLRSLDESNYSLLITNILLIIVFGGGVFLYFKKPNQ
ncbi:MAG: BatD family protein [Cyclobacteriaceae bacterium]|nr:BatD family protein [Cyclobacteriaceae bacterium]MCH8516495.1 BatD family protein [Cyclobacteriaceae bacterium]